MTHQHILSAIKKRETIWQWYLTSFSHCWLDLHTCRPPTKMLVSAQFYSEQTFSVKAERNEALPVCCNNINIISVQMLLEVWS